MIKNKAQLREYNVADRERYITSYKLPFFLRWLIGEEQALIIRYLRTFRRYEYYINTSKGLLGKLRINLYHFLHLRNCIKLNCWLHPNTIGPGIRIVHLGGRIELNAKSIGSNLTVTAGVIVGKKNNDDNKAIIGNNVELTLGCKVIGAVMIGDNSIIAPNSVVINDVPANTIASGVPISILKIRK